MMKICQLSQYEHQILYSCYIKSILGRFIHCSIYSCYANNLVLAYKSICEKFLLKYLLLPVLHMRLNVKS